MPRRLHKDHALAIGGCFCNDLRYVAEEMGVTPGKIAVTVTLNLEGRPLLANSATMTVSCATLDGSDPADHKGRGDFHGQQLTAAGFAGERRNARNRDRFIDGMTAKTRRL